MILSCPILKKDQATKLEHRGLEPKTMGHALATVDEDVGTSQTMSTGISSLIPLHVSILFVNHVYPSMEPSRD